MKKDGIPFTFATDIKYITFAVKAEGCVSATLHHHGSFR